MRLADVCLPLHEPGAWPTAAAVVAFIVDLVMRYVVFAMIAPDVIMAPESYRMPLMPLQRLGVVELAELGECESSNPTLPRGDSR